MTKKTMSKTNTTNVHVPKNQTKQDKINKLLTIYKNESVMEKKLVSIMERPHHLRLLHYRDERVTPEAPTPRQSVGERR